MKFLFSIAFLTGLLFLTSCKDEVSGNKFDYHAHIYSPDSATKHLGDTLHIDVEFESHTGETIHNINVRIYNASTNVEVYNKPASSHLFDPDGDYEYEDHIVLSTTNGFSAGDWVIQAKVWGETDGEEEEESTVTFHISN